MVSCTSDQPDRADAEDASESSFPVPVIEYQPRHYICYRASAKPVIDGRLTEGDWQKAEWTESFVDIEGESKPLPRFKTQVKMLWDEDYFYIGAEMEEPHLWGTLTERDAVIYHDNDFEVFIDPDGDSHEYYELEINALGTEWDLLLIRPYRDGAPAVNAWDITGLKTAVAMHGTLNDPGDVDSGWNVEIAIPWKTLAECAHRSSPPEDNDVWWVNFSRVQWQLEIQNGSYVKMKDSSGEKSLPENNWVWSPQGLIAMHYPEMWGLVQFSQTMVGGKQKAFAPPEDLEARWAMRRLYYAQRDYQDRTGKYTSSLNDLELGPKEIMLERYSWPPSLQATPYTFDAFLNSIDGRKRLSINTEGRLQSFSTTGK
ncbi:MAG: carbohydrate-binding family 9-like protein [FCB group bacterium]|nr:carbohydrate-binding family 9-like protein [FCB group bacterium]